MKFYRTASIRIRLRIGKTNDFEPNPIFINNLRIAFSVNKFRGWAANSASIKVWNLNADKRSKFKNFGDEVTLYAGYQEPGTNGALQVLYVGNTTSVSHIFEQPEIVTSFECASGDKFLNQDRITISFGANVSARTVVSEICRKMDMQVAFFAPSQDLKYENGFKYIGPGKDVLQNVLAYLGLQGSNQDGLYYIIPINGSLGDTQIPVNQMTGMIGVPERFTYRYISQWKAEDAPTTGYKVNVMLNPNIIPGSTINLQSSHIDFKGPYRVNIVRHDGDTFGFPWVSNLETTVLPAGNPSA